MQELDQIEIETVSGGMTAVEGGAAVLGLVAMAPVGFAMGFGLAVAGGLFYAGYKMAAY